MKQNILKFAALVIFFVCFVVLDIDAQCAMCRASAESNLVDGGSTGKGLNRGILYLLTLPYILVGTLAYIWWKNRQAVLKEEQELELREMLAKYDIALQK